MSLVAHAIAAASAHVQNPSPIPTSPATPEPPGGRGLFGLGEALWVSISAIATAAAAGVTALMALYTRRLAKETKAVETATEQMASATSDMALETRGLVLASSAERAQTELHHQQSLAPLVVVYASCQRFSDSPHKVQLRFKGLIRNLGAGPASGIYVCVKTRVTAPAQKYVSPMGAGEAWNIDLRWEAPADISNAHYFYECFISYRSIFITEGYTIQRSETGKAEDAFVVELVPPERTKPQEVLDARAAFISGSAVEASGNISQAEGSLRRS